MVFLYNQQLSTREWDFFKEAYHFGFSQIEPEQSFFDIFYLRIFSLPEQGEGIVLQIGLMFSDHIPEDNSEFSGCGGDGGVSTGMQNILRSILKERVIDCAVHIFLPRETILFSLKEIILYTRIRLNLHSIIITIWIKYLLILWRLCFIRIKTVN